MSLNEDVKSLIAKLEDRDAEIIGLNRKLIDQAYRFSREQDNVAAARHERDRANRGRDMAVEEMLKLARLVDDSLPDSPTWRKARTILTEWLPEDTKEGIAERQLRDLTVPTFEPDRATTAEEDRDQRIIDESRDE